MSNSLRPRGLQPIRLPRPWDSPGKSIGVVCHFLLQCMKVKNASEVSQSCLTLSDPHGLQPTRLLHPWDFPGKSIGVGCHCLPQMYMCSLFKNVNRYFLGRKILNYLHFCFCIFCVLKTLMLFLSNSHSLQKVKT